MDTKETDGDLAIGCMFAIVLALATLAVAVEILKPIFEILGGC